MGVQQDQTALTHPHLPNFSTYVTATINGQVKRLPVWDTEVQGNRAIAWIEAVEGVNSAVHFDDLRPVLSTDYSIRMFLDGTHVNGLATSQNNFISLDAPNRRQKFTGQEESATTERPFLWGKLRLTDDEDEACTDENLIKNLGTIVLKYQRIILGPPSYSAEQVVKSFGDRAIHEKVKKSQLSHQATVGASVRKAAAGQKSTMQSIDTINNPLVSFEFRYRSRQLLQLESHMPDDAPPLVEPLAPIANGASGSNANNDDGLSRKERIAKMRAEMARLDADSDDDDLQVDVKPKKAKIEDKKVKPEKGVKTEGKKVKQEIIVLSDSD